MKISKTAMVIEPSLTRQLFTMARQYDDVIDLTLGDPDIKPSETIRNAASEAIMAGKTRYSVNAGLIELREEIAKDIKEDYKLNVNPASQIIMTVGGMEALYLGLAAIIDPGDEVILHAPYYMNYVQMVRMFGGVPVLIETTEETGFSFNADDVKKVITDKTVAMIINTPSNPTGQVINGELLDEIAEIAVEKDILVISDEVYRALVFEGKHESIATRPDMMERTLIVDSLSKRFSMTGYRLGYGVGPEEWIANMVKMQENVAACAPLPSQHAGIIALRECKDNREIREVFYERCKVTAENINTSDKIHCITPVATFYLFVNIEKTGLKSLDFAYKLLEQEHVAVAPGISYGEKYDTYIRIACTLDKDILLEATKKINRFVESLGD